MNTTSFIDNIAQQFILPKNFYISQHLKKQNIIITEWKYNNYEKIEIFIENFRSKIIELNKNFIARLSTNDFEELNDFRSKLNVLDNSNNYYEFLNNYFEKQSDKTVFEYEIYMQIYQQTVEDLIDLGFELVQAEISEEIEDNFEEQEKFNLQEFLKDYKKNAK